MESHKTDLRRVLEKLKVAGFTLHGSKCLLSHSSTTYLGFQYSPHGVIPSAENTRAIAEWPIPQNTKELRSYLGVANSIRTLSLALLTYQHHLSNWPVARLRLRGMPNIKQHLTHLNSQLCPWLPKETRSVYTNHWCSWFIFSVSSVSCGQIISNDYTTDCNSSRTGSSAINNSCTPTNQSLSSPCFTQVEEISITLL